MRSTAFRFCFQFQLQPPVDTRINPRGKNRLGWKVKRTVCELLLSCHVVSTPTNAISRAGSRETPSAATTPRAQRHIQFGVRAKNLPGPLIAIVPSPQTFPSVELRDLSFTYFAILFGASDHIYCTAKLSRDVVCVVANRMAGEPAAVAVGAAPCREARSQLGRSSATPLKVRCVPPANRLPPLPIASSRARFSSAGKLSAPNDARDAAPRSSCNFRHFPNSRRRRRPRPHHATPLAE